MLDLPMTALGESLRERVISMTGTASDFDVLIDMIGTARVVCIGEASHGTHEFYAQRAALTKRLIEEQGFTAVAAEADWPDAYRLNRYVRGESDDADSESALGDFKRFPAWMWRNTVVQEFAEWLHAHNDALPKNAPGVGFYGLDLYSLYTSMEAVIQYLDKVDPEAAQRARYRYSCFEQFHEDPQEYGYAASFSLDDRCEGEVVSQLAELQQHANQWMYRDGRMAQDAYFYAEQNARLAKNAETYYRSMFMGRVSSWNIRDQHMGETLIALIDHLDRQQDGKARIVVWAHNSHLGDARATEMGDQGELNLGQLAREHYGADAVLIGFSTHHGTVTAASRWGGPAERKTVRPGLAGSYEHIFHDVILPGFTLILRDEGLMNTSLAERRLQRAIGVIYRPESERMSHYYFARLPQQFDAIIHLDETRALEPLERSSHWEAGDLPETYPSGI